MKKFTIYEIEKLTDGKVTKYKLNQAIQKGELKAEKVAGIKKGRGLPKYFIHEADLKKYLEKIENLRKEKLKIVGENADSLTPQKTAATFQPFENKKDTIIDMQNQKIEDIEKRITALESKTNQEKRSPDKNNAETRRKLLLELADMSIFSIKKRQKTIEDLIKLG